MLRIMWPDQMLVFLAIVVSPAMFQALLRSTEGCSTRPQQPCGMQEKADEQVVFELGSADPRESAAAVLEVVRRGERMIPHLLKLKGVPQAFRGYGLGHPEADQLTLVASGDQKRDRGRVVTLEVAALYLICGIYYGDLSFAQSPYLTDVWLPPRKRKAINSSRLVSRAWASTMTWAGKEREIGVEALRAQQQGPLSGSGVAFW